ncbi:MAG: glycosyltransferase [Bacteroidales bacterium]|nr:glycosyltransferase [Bacteroidales bacterium]
MLLEKSKRHILFLARWYPNRYDSMPGLFIQRHAEAVALRSDVSVVYVHPVSVKGNYTYEVETGNLSGVLVVRVYCFIPESANRFTKLIRFFKALNLGVKEVVGRRGKFQLIHVHVLTRMGLAALYYKWKYQTPYLITEHWTRYLSNVPFKGSVHKWLTQWVVKESYMVTTVSEDLSRAMMNQGLKHHKYRVIRNVVAPFFYDYPISFTGNKKEFIHVSCFTDKQKNISGLLRVIARLSEVRNDFHFSLVGEGEDLEKMKEYAQELNISGEHLTFTGLLQRKSLASKMSKADALVLFSNYENMPVVINESFVLGVPVFSTRVGGIAEIINTHNGRLVEKGDETALFNQLTDFIEGRIVFDKASIKKEALNAFSYETVGARINSFYDQILD